MGRCPVRNSRAAAQHAYIARRSATASAARTRALLRHQSHPLQCLAARHPVHDGGDQAMSKRVTAEEIADAVIKANEILGLDAKSV